MQRIVFLSLLVACCVMFAGCAAPAENDQNTIVYKPMQKCTKDEFVTQFNDFSDPDMPKASDFKEDTNGANITYTTTLTWVDDFGFSTENNAVSFAMYMYNYAGDPDGIKANGVRGSDLDLYGNRLLLSATGNDVALVTDIFDKLNFYSPENWENQSEYIDDDYWVTFNVLDGAMISLDIRAR